MAHFVHVPPDRLEPAVLNAMLEEFASRDGTDYGVREHSLEEKVDDLKRQLTAGDLVLLYDLDSEQWDLCDRQRAGELQLELAP